MIRVLFLSYIIVSQFAHAIIDPKKIDVDCYQQLIHATPTFTGDGYKSEHKEEAWCHQDTHLKCRQAWEGYMTKFVVPWVEGLYAAAVVEAQMKINQAISAYINEMEHKGCTKMAGDTSITIPAPAWGAWKDTYNIQCPPAGQQGGTYELVSDRKGTFSAPGGGSAEEWFKVYQNPYYYIEPGCASGWAGKYHNDAVGTVTYTIKVPFTWMCPNCPPK